MAKSYEVTYSKLVTMVGHMQVQAESQKEAEEQALAHLLDNRGIAWQAVKTEHQEPRVSPKAPITKEALV